MKPYSSKTFLSAALTLSWACTILFHGNIMAARYVFQWPTTQAGDNLVSLYNAYAYAKKYNLILAVAPFNHIELFNCHTMLPRLPAAIFNNRHDHHTVVGVTREQDIVKHLHNSHVHFYVHVLSERIPIHPSHLAEARQIVGLNNTIQLDYLKSLAEKDSNAFTIAVHIRKGNGGGQIYDGQLWSEQIFDFDRSLVHYLPDTTGNPFNFFEAEEKFSCTKPQFPTIDSPDIYWTTKFPPEQYYIDQINKIAAEKAGPIVVRVFTDDKDPLSLIDRLQASIDNESIRLEYHDNRSKGYHIMMLEDLYLISHCDAFIRSTSRFAIIAELLGNFETVIFPINGTWLNGKQLIMSDVVVRKPLR